MQRLMYRLVSVMAVICLSACGGGEQESDNGTTAIPFSTKQWENPDYDSYSSSSDPPVQAEQDTLPQSPLATEPPIPPAPIPPSPPKVVGEKVKADGFTYVKPEGWEEVTPVSSPYSTVLLELNSVQANNFSIVARYQATPKYSLSGNISSMKSGRQGELKVLEEIQVGGRKATWIVVEGDRGAGMMVWVPMQGDHDKPDSVWTFGLGSNRRNIDNFKRDMIAFVDTIEFEEVPIHKAEGITYVRPRGWSVVEGLDQVPGAVLRLQQPEVAEGNGITVYSDQSGDRALADEIKALQAINPRGFKQEKIEINGRVVTRLYLIDGQIKTITVRLWYPVSGDHEKPDSVWIFEATMSIKQDTYYQQVLSDLLYLAEFD